MNADAIEALDKLAPSGARITRVGGVYQALNGKWVAYDWCFEGADAGIMVDLDSDVTLIAGWTIEQLRRIADEHRRHL